MPHNAMVVLFGAVALYCVAAFWFSMRAFWRDINGDAKPAGIAAFWQAVANSAHLTYLHGGGGGCASEDDQPSPARRIYHHLTFYGFLFCFAATSVATIYHYAFGWRAPDALTSLPVALGIIGGVGLLMVLRDTPAMGILLAIHLGVVLGYS